MEGLVNYSSEDEQDESGQQTAAERDGSASSGSGGRSSASPGRSNGKANVVGGHSSGSGRAAGLTIEGGGGGGTPTARSNNNSSNTSSSSYRGEEDTYRHHKAPTPNSGSRTGSAYYAREGRDARDSRYAKDNRYDYKHERGRPKDYKSDYKRERDNYHDNRRTAREDERSRYSTSTASSYQRRGAGNTRDERARYTGGNEAFSSTNRHYTPQHQHQYQQQQQHQQYHYRAHDDRVEQRSTEYYARGERSSGGVRHRRRSASRSPSPAQQAYGKRQQRTEKPYHSRHRARDSHSRSKSRTPPTRRSNSHERDGTPTQQPLEKARLSALQMERKIQEPDADYQSAATSSYKSPQTHESATSSYARSSEALLALPLSETAPKQPNVIAVANVASTAKNGEPAVIQLPSYYNPSVINPNKYAEQVQKRKLLWGAKKVEDTAAKWGNAQFSQDSDGKVASKFMRLMGIKNAVLPKSDGADGAQSPATAVSAAPDVKSREVMFSNMEQQYEVARQATHTMRGVGLGFSSQSRPY